MTQIYFPQCCEAVVSHSFFACLVSMVTLCSLSLQRNPKAGSSSEVPAAFSTAERERQTCRGAGENAGRSHKSSKGQWTFMGGFRSGVLAPAVLAAFLEAAQICSMWLGCFKRVGSFTCIMRLLAFREAHAVGLRVTVNRQSHEHTTHTSNNSTWP